MPIKMRPTQQNFILNAQGQLTDVSVIYDDGSIQGAHYDTTGQPWSCAGN